MKRYLFFMILLAVFTWTSCAGFKVFLNSYSFVQIYDDYIKGKFLNRMRIHIDNTDDSEMGVITYQLIGKNNSILICDQYRQNVLNELIMESEVKSIDITYEGFDRFYYKGILFSELDFLCRLKGDNNLEKLILYRLNRNGFNVIGSIFTNHTHQYCDSYDREHGHIVTESEDYKEISIYNKDLKFIKNISFDEKVFLDSLMNTAYSGKKKYLLDTYDKFEFRTDVESISQVEVDPGVFLYNDNPALFDSSGFYYDGKFIYDYAGIKHEINCITDNSSSYFIYNTCNGIYFFNNEEILKISDDIGYRVIYDSPYSHIVKMIQTLLVKTDINDSNKKNYFKFYEIDENFKLWENEIPPLEGTLDIIFYCFDDKNNDLSRLPTPVVFTDKGVFRLVKKE